MRATVLRCGFSAAAAACSTAAAATILPSRSTCEASPVPPTIPKTPYEPGTWRYAVQQIWEPPPFSTRGDRFDQGSFLGRALHFFNVLGDFTTLLTSQEELQRNLQLLEAHAGGADHGASDADLWRARKLQEAMVHPETGEVIFPLFRFSAFAPVNVPIAAGLLLPNASLAATAFWQWVNQSYNVAVNYANRSGDGLPGERLFAAYVAATASSLAVSFGLGPALKQVAAGRGLTGPAVTRMLRVTVPFVAVSLGCCINVLCTRYQELTEGVNVFAAGECLGLDVSTPLGKSPAAGRLALAQCCAARVLWIFPILTLSPLITDALSCRPPFLHRPRLALMMELVVSGVIIWVSVPLGMALYPAKAQVDAKYLEPHFHNLMNTRGDPVTVIHYNKGL